jgi:hypothetical protein
LGAGFYSLRRHSTRRSDGIDQRPRFSEERTGFRVSYYPELLRNVVKIRTVVSLFAILILSVQNVYGVESEFYCEQLDGSKFYYDQNNIVYSSGKARIWHSVVLSDVGREYVKKNFDISG